MKDNNTKAGKYVLFGVCLLAVVLFVTSIILPSGQTTNDKDVVRYHSNICPYVIRADGSRENLPCVHNTVTTAGLNMVRDTMLGNGNSALTRLALGNGTAPAAGDTTLNKIWTDCNLAIGAATCANNAGNGNWSCWKTWTSNCDNAIVNTTAVYNTTAVMFAGALFTSTTLQTNDQITVNYTISVS